jgi:hypothetical protein
MCFPGNEVSSNPKKEEVMSTSVSNREMSSIEKHKN